MRSAVLIAGTALATSLAVLPAAAQTVWVGASGAWEVPSNWTPAVVPTGGVDVVIDRPGDLIVTFGGTSSLVATIGNLTSKEQLNVAAGLLVINGNATIDASYSQSGGAVVGGAGSITIKGTTLLGNAVFEAGGDLITNGPLQLGVGGVAFRGDRTLIVNGGAVWSGGEVDLNEPAFLVPPGPGGKIFNANGSTFEVQFPGVMTATRISPEARFTNAGTFLKSNPGPVSFEVPFENRPGATIEVTRGVLILEGDGTVLRGSLNIAGGLLRTGRDRSTDQVFVDGLSGAGSKGDWFHIGGTMRLSGHSAFGGPLSSISGKFIFANDATFEVGGLQTSDEVSFSGGQLVVSGAANIAAGTVLVFEHTMITRGPLTLNGIGIDIGSVLKIEGGAAWGRGLIDLDPFGNAGSGTIVNAPGSVFETDFGGIMAASAGDPGLFVNQGTFRKTGPDRTVIAVSFRNEDGGAVDVLGGALQFTGKVSNVDGGILRGGAWRVANGAELDLAGATPIVTNAATVELQGAGSSLVTRVGTVATALEKSLTSNLGTLRLDHRDFIASGNLTNAGLIDLRGSLLGAASLANLPGGRIVGDGTVRERVTNAGEIRAQGGTLTLSKGVVGPGGTLQIDAGARLVLGGATTNETGRLRLLGSGIDLGAAALHVTKDYENIKFGVGNDFDPLANVTGAQGIFSVGTTQALVVGGATRVDREVVLDFGRVRGGTTKTLSYQIANLGVAGASTDLRGAIQTRFGGEGITDRRLTGSGVTAQNFGPLAGGSSTTAYAVTFGGAGGSLDGQSIRILNNFLDVKDQVLTFTGSTTQLAIGQAATVPSSGLPVDLGRFRVGDVGPSRTFAVTNTTTGEGAERLGIGTVTASGHFAATGISGALIAPGTTQSGALTLGVSGGVAGVNTGAARIQYVSNGQLLDPGFANVASNVQDIALKATGYAVANPNALPATLDFGTVVKGSSQARFLTISNEQRAGVPLGFQEGLDASFGTMSGPAAAKFVVGGALSNLAAGGVSSRALGIKLDTSEVGSFSASVPVLFRSNGAGTSGFSPLDLPTQNLGLAAGVIEARVVNGAAAAILNVQPVDLAARRVGDAPSFAALQIRNTADPVAETLSASFAATTGGVVTSGTTIGGLGAQTTDAITMRVGIDTSVAGLRAGRATVAFAGDLGTTLPSVDVEVQGKVYQRAAVESLDPVRLDLGVVRVRGTPEAHHLALANVAPIAGLNDGLTAELRTIPRAVDFRLDGALSGPGVAAGTVLDRAFTAALRSDQIGAVSQSIVVSFGSANRDMETERLGERTFELFGQVNDIADPLFSKVAGDGDFLRLKSGPRIDFGDVALGRSSQIVLSLLNTIEFGDGLAGSFDLSGLGDVVEASGFDPVLLDPRAFVDDLVLTFNGRSLGAYSGFFTFDWASVYPGLVDFAGTIVRVEVFANVVGVAPPSEVPAPATALLLLVGAATLVPARRCR